MAKDNSKSFTYAATVTVNGVTLTLYFRKARQRMEFINLARYLEGVSGSSVDGGIYVYEDAGAAINTVANFANRHVKI